MVCFRGGSAGLNSCVAGGTYRVTGVAFRLAAGSLGMLNGGVRVLAGGSQSIVDLVAHVVVTVFVGVLLVGCIYDLEQLFLGRILVLGIYSHRIKTGSAGIAGFHEGGVFHAGGMF